VQWIGAAAGDAQSWRRFFVPAVCVEVQQHDLRHAIPFNFPGATMNKSDMVQELANRTGLSKTDATRAVEAVFDPDAGLIAEALRKGDRVQITGFGTFEAKERKARTGRNPRTGTEIRIGPTTSASFRPGKALKDAVKPS
jgi:DNA-binding protein HU-beta